MIEINLDEVSYEGHEYGYHRFTVEGKRWRLTKGYKGEWRMFYRAKGGWKLSHDQTMFDTLRILIWPADE